MKFGFTDSALDLIVSVFRKHPRIEEVRIYGSRATGGHQPQSDVDLVLYGDIDVKLRGTITLELDELPLPYGFDVLDYAAITHEPLKRRIVERGEVLYRRENAVRLQP